MNTLLLTLALALGQDAPFRPLDLDGALEAARAEDRLVLVHFTTEWDRRRPDVEQYTWSDGLFRSWVEEDLVAIVLDYDRDRRVARRYEVGMSSYTLLLDRDGDEVGRFYHRTPRDPSKFRKWIEQVRAGETEVQVAAALVAAEPDEPLHRARYGVALALAERPQAALEQYLAAWDLGVRSQDSILQRFRRHDMIGNIVKLDEVVAGAGDALRERLSTLREQLAEGRPAARAVLGPDATDEDLDALIQAWAADTTGLTLVMIGFSPAYDLFDEYQGTEHALAVRRGVWRFVLGRLAPERRYQEILDVPADLDAHLDALFDWIARSIEMQLEFPGNKAWQVRNQVTDDAMREIVPVFEALGWANRNDEALALYDRLAERDPRVMSVVLLIRALGRAERPELGREIALRALPRFEDENDRGKIVRQCQKHLGIEVDPDR